MSTPASEDGLRHITLDTVENSLQRSYITMDKDGDGHYDVLSALQNLFEALMLMPVFTMQHVWLKQEISPSLARRLTVIAYEDIGLANPDAQVHTVTAWSCTE